jgi:hypothetical protein
MHSLYNLHAFINILRFYHWVDTSSGVLVVPKGIIRLVVSDSAMI